jgi:hypothetical protein
VTADKPGAQAVEAIEETRARYEPMQKLVDEFFDDLWRDREMPSGLLEGMRYAVDGGKRVRGVRSRSYTTICRLWITRVTAAERMPVMCVSERVSRCLSGMP